MGETTKKAKTYPVWVGSLSEKVNEHILEASFKVYGPIHSLTIMRDPLTRKSKNAGYINYYNSDVAEIAAESMNGKEICRKKIKTKGPTDIPPPNNQPENLEKKKEIKQLTDCYYYLFSGECTPNNGQECLYRHSDQARANPVCERWRDMSCKNPQCKYKHPSQKQYAENGGGKKITLTRCASHNMFKCLGECGNLQCSSHFEDERDLSDHISNSAKLSPCVQCKAVFFSEEDKMHHTHNTPRKTRNASLPESSNNGDKREPIGVFWDIENCQIPRNKSPMSIVGKIRKRFYKKRREVEFICVCDIKKIKEDVLEDLNKTQINVTHVNASSKNAADDKLKQALRRFAHLYSSPATVVLISSDINFSSEISDLRHRHNLNVILVHNEQVSEALKDCASECVRYDILLKDVEAVNCSDYSNAVEEPIKEVLIRHLPPTSALPEKQIRGRLTRLVNNTGGKVLKIMAVNPNSYHNTAIIRFADQDSAKRAIQRLNKEQIGNRQIQASIYTKNKAVTKYIVPSEEIRNNNKDENKNNKKVVHTNLKNMSSKSTPNLISSPHQQKIQNKNQNNTNQAKQFGSTALLNGEPSNNSAPQQRMLPRNFSGLLMSQPHNMPPPPLMGMMSFFDMPPPLLSPQHPMPPPNFLPPPPPPRPPQMMQPKGLVRPPRFQQHDSSNLNNSTEVIVTNLCKKQSAKELEKGLIAVFRRHSKVLSCTVTPQKGKHMRASLRVPKLSDANTCIMQLNNTMFFDRSIKLALASVQRQPEQAVNQLREEVKAIILQDFAGWMSLTKFLTEYREQHKRSFHVFDFDQMKDLVYVDGQPGHQFVSLLQFPVGMLKVKCDDACKQNIVATVKKHGRKVPLVSIPGLYWSYNAQTLPLNKSGQPFFKEIPEELALTGDVSVRKDVYCKRKPRKNGQKVDVAEFRSEIVQLVQRLPGFKIAINRLVPMYHLFFGRQLVLSEYGLSDLASLLCAVDDVIEVLETEAGKIVRFTYKFKTALLHTELYELVMSRDKQKLAVSSLLTAYFIYYGRKLYHLNFGFKDVHSLVNSLSEELFKVTGSGDSSVILVVERKTSKVRKSAAQVGEEISAVIAEQPNQQLEVHNLASEYFKKFETQLKVKELGYSKLNDLLDAIKHYVEVRGSSDQRLLCMRHADGEPNRHREDGEMTETNAKLWPEVVRVLKTTPQKAVLLNKLAVTYTDTLKKMFPVVENQKIDQLFKSAPQHVLTLGENANRLLILVEADENYPSMMLVKLMERILYRCDNFCAQIEHIAQVLKDKHNVCVSKGRLYKEAKEYKNIFETPELFSLSGITLKRQAALKHLEHEVVSLLEASGKQNLRQLTKSYQIMFGKLPFQQDLHETLLSLHPGLLEVEDRGKISLGKLGGIYAKCKAVIAANCGAMLLCNFAPEFGKRHGAQLKASEYGFTRISDLVTCFSMLFTVFGEKNLKVVVLNDEILRRRPNNALENEGEGSNGSDYLSCSSGSLVDETEDLLRFEENELLVDFSDENLIDVSEQNSQQADWWMEGPALSGDSILEPELSQRDSPRTIFDDLIKFDDSAEASVLDETPPIPFVNNEKVVVPTDEIQAMSMRDSDLLLLAAKVTQEAPPTTFAYFNIFDSIRCRRPVVTSIVNKPSLELNPIPSAAVAAPIEQKSQQQPKRKLAANFSKPTTTS